MEAVRMVLLEVESCSVCPHFDSDGETDGFCSELGLEINESWHIFKKCPLPKKVASIYEMMRNGCEK